MTVQPEAARRRLEERRTATTDLIDERRAAAGLDTSQAAASSELSDIDQHPSDAASDSAQRDLVMGTIDELRTRIREVDEAIRRVDDGTYGVCTECGERIPDERLEMLPEATLCVDHRRAADRAMP